MKRKRILVQTAVALCSVAVLISLGIWQLQRKSWKDHLLAQIHVQAGRVPAAYSSWLARNETRLRNFRDDPAASGLFAPVVVDGRFRHAEELYVFTTRHSSAGYLVFTPFDTSDGRSIFVNRGFVPEHLRSPATRLSGLTKGNVEVRGLIRAAKKPGWFTPEPDTGKGIWYIADLKAFAERLKSVVETSHYVEADSTPNPGGWPKGRDVEEFASEIPNWHLGYALTWFALAAALGVLFPVYLRGQLRNSKA